jgi:hypothetical protein
MEKEGTFSAVNNIQDKRFVYGVVVVVVFILIINVSSKINCFTFAEQ